MRKGERGGMQCVRMQVDRGRSAHPHSIVSGEIVVDARHVGAGHVERVAGIDDTFRECHIADFQLTHQAVEILGREPRGTMHSFCCEGHLPLTTIFERQADLEQALDWLATADPRLVRILAASGIPELRRRSAGFAGIAAIVVGQQLSTASAAAIWGRLAAALHPVDATTMLATADDVLGQIGLSRAKIRALKAIAGEITAGRLDLNDLATMDADAAHALLTKLPGVGPWTADVYLLFCLGNADAWPAGDLAVQEAMRMGLGLAQRPAPKEMARLAEPWRPFRGAAAHLWWAYYRCLRQRTGAPLG